MSEQPSLFILYSEMSHALELRDWARLDRVNGALGPRLASLAGPLSAENAAQLLRMQRLCERVLVACRDEHCKLRDQLRQHRDTAEGLAAYEQACIAAEEHEDV